MLKLPILLAEIDSKVLETTDTCQTWNLGNPYLGVKIDNNRRQLDELTASCYFTLPKMTRGRVSLLTIARGRPGDSSCMPSFWDPTELEQEFGGAYLDVVYDATRSIIEVRNNVGGETTELVGVVLEGATPQQVCDQVLELYIEVSQGRIFASVHNRFANGDIYLSAVGSGVKKPWCASPAGHWWILSGLTHVFDNHAVAMPPGFGLSDLRVTLAAETDDAVGSLLYRGALDHLVSEPPKGVAEGLIRALTQHGKDLRSIATDIETTRLLMSLRETPEPEPTEPESLESASFEAKEAAAARVFASGSARACVAAVEEMLALEDEEALEELPTQEELAGLGGLPAFD